jgi:hypothetical protein
VHEQLQRLHLTARNVPALHRLAVLTRLLLALAFVPTALVKVQGHRFTALSTSTPIGAFFEALYQSGAYWRFLGWSQLISGVLLLIPSTSALGALLFFPIILNIFVITVALHFTGTPIITGLMLLSNLFLLCWDYHRFAAIGWGARATYEVPPSPQLPQIERVGLALGGAAGLGLLLASRGYSFGSPRTTLIVCLGTGLVAAGMVIAGWVTSARASAPRPTN